MTFTADVQNVRHLPRHKHGGTYTILHLLAGWGTSSPCVRDGRPRAADTRDAGFHTNRCCGRPTVQI